MRVTNNASSGGSKDGLAPTMKLVIALVFSLTVALLNMTQRPAPKPAELHVNQQASALAPAKTTDTPTAPAVATQPTPKPFDAADPTTWPKCAADEIVRADNGQCDKKAVEAAAAPGVVAAGGSGSCSAEIAKYDWNVNTATNVAIAESGLNPGQVNDNPATGDYSIGCFQVNIYGANARTRPSEAALKDAAINVQWAYNNYVANGHSFIGQWGVCRNKVQCY